EARSTCAGASARIDIGHGFGRVSARGRERAMFVSIANFEQQGADLEEGVRHVLEEVVPSIQGAEGLRAGDWAVDRENGKRVSVLVWESAGASASAMPAVVEAIAQRRAAAGRTEPQASPTGTGRFEVIAHT